MTEGKAASYDHPRALVVIKAIGEYRAKLRGHGPSDVRCARHGCRAMAAVYGPTSFDAVCQPHDVDDAVALLLTAKDVADRGVLDPDVADTLMAAAFDLVTVAHTPQTGDPA